MCSYKKKIRYVSAKTLRYNHYTFEEIVRAVDENRVNNPQPRRQFNIPCKNYVPDWLMEWSGRLKEESHEKNNETV